MKKKWNSKGQCADRKRERERRVCTDPSQNRATINKYVCKVTDDMILKKKEEKRNQWKGYEEWNRKHWWNGRTHGLWFYFEIMRLICGEIILSLFHIQLNHMNSRRQTKSFKCAYSICSEWAACRRSHTKHRTRTVWIFLFTWHDYLLRKNIAPTQSILPKMFDFIDCDYFTQII